MHIRRGGGKMGAARKIDADVFHLPAAITGRLIRGGQDFVVQRARQEIAGPWENGKAIGQGKNIALRTGASRMKP